MLGSTLGSTYIGKLPGSRLQVLNPKPWTLNSLRDSLALSLYRVYMYIYFFKGITGAAVFVGRFCVFLLSFGIWGLLLGEV